jgi:serine/threonine-protein kinase RsbW
VRAEGTFRGRLPSFADVRALAEAFGTAAGADHGTTLRVILLLEELFTNTVTHGYADAGEGLVWVTLAAGSGVIEIIYEDAGPAFDPLTGAPEPLLGPRGEEPGGLGLALVRGLSTSAAYARIGARNRITLTVSTGSAPAAPPGA